MAIIRNVSKTADRQREWTRVVVVPEHYSGSTVEMVVGTGGGGLVLAQDARNSLTKSRDLDDNRTSLQQREGQGLDYAKKLDGNS